MKQEVLWKALDTYNQFDVGYKWVVKYTYDVTKTNAQIKTD